MITTNQTAHVGNPLTATLRCHHQPGRTTPDTCAFLRSLSRLRAEVARAEQSAARGDTTAQQITALWLLFAEASTAFDHCSNNLPRQQPS